MKRFGLGLLGLLLVAALIMGGKAVADHTPVVGRSENVLILTSATNAIESLWDGDATGDNNMRVRLGVTWEVSSLESQDAIKLANEQTKAKLLWDRRRDYRLID